MRTFRWLTAAALVFAVGVPSVTSAQMAMKPTQEQVKTALRATNPSLMQVRQMKPMIENFKQQTQNADDAKKKAAAKTLVEQLKTVLTPEQQATFKQSLMSQMTAAH